MNKEEMLQHPQENWEGLQENQEGLQENQEGPELVFDLQQVCELNCQHPPRKQRALKGSRKELQLSQRSC